MKQFGKTLPVEQEVMNNIAEMMMELYVSESLVLRIDKLETFKNNTDVYKDILDVNIYDLSVKILKSASDAVNSLGSPEAFSQLLNAVGILTRVKGINVKNARRRIADKLIEDNQYNF